MSIRCILIHETRPFGGIDSANNSLIHGTHFLFSHVVKKLAKVLLEKNDATLRNCLVVPILPVHVGYR